MKTLLPKIIITICWLGSICGVAASVSIIIIGFSSSGNGISEATYITLAVAVTILPYCLARAVSEIVNQYFKA